ncbi:MAG: undecaprenyl-diphosphatase [Bacillota bacterium]
MFSLDHQAVQLLGNIVGKYAWLDNSMIALSAYGPYIFELVLVIMWFSGRSESMRLANRKRALYGFFSAIIAMTVNLVVGSFFFRVRPFLNGESKLLYQSATDSSFPSDHAAGGGSISTSIMFGKRWLGRFLMVFAVLVTISRVYVGAHYPFDVVTGLLIGVLSAWLVERNREHCDKVVEPLLMFYERLVDKFEVLKKLGF